LLAALPLPVWYDHGNVVTVRGALAMSLRNLTAATALAVAVISTSAHALDTSCVKERAATFDGSCWNSLRGSEKDAIILGIWAGERSRSTGDSLIGPWRGTLHWLEVPESTTTTDIIDYFDLLYKTPANRGILWHWAYILAAMNARDDDSDDRLPLIRFLRDHGSLPTSGYIVGAKAPDIITVKTDQGQLDIHLEGVTNKGMNDAQRNRATAFLDALSSGSDSELQVRLEVWFAEQRSIEPTRKTACDKPPGLPVSLEYHWQLFQDGKTLSASVFTDTGSVVCLKDRKIQITELDPEGTMTYREALSLNDLLISIGLALPDQDVDPKWPEAIANQRHQNRVPEDTKSKGLYIYGTSRVPVIDGIIAHGTDMPAGLIQ